MNEEKLRESIAIACGWKCDNKGGWKRWYHPEGRPFGNSPSGLPRYLSERDAAIEAVIDLIGNDTDKRFRFGEMLYHEVPEANLRVNDDYSVDWDELYMMFVATPLQICTALAKALNLTPQQEPRRTKNEREEV